jgi:hypothetical protein
LSFGLAAWTLAFGRPASPPPLFGHHRQTATGPRPLAGPASPRGPRLPPSGKPAESRRPLRPNRASPGRCPSPAPWQEADLPRHLPLSLLYWPPLPPPLSVSGAHHHQCRRPFPAIARCMSSLPHDIKAIGSPRTTPPLLAPSFASLLAQVSLSLAHRPLPPIPLRRPATSPSAALHPWLVPLSTGAAESQALASSGCPFTDGPW